MPKRRIILLPGFSEDAFIFDEIKTSFIDFELVFVDYRKTLAECNLRNIDVWEFTKKLIKNYSITESDLLIGHSMGGYFSFAIRELISAEICMIASFNDPNKINRITKSKFISVLIARTGFIKSNYFQSMIKKPTIGKYFEKIFNAVIVNMKTFSHSQIAKMTALSFGDKLMSEKPNPLRIHARNDKIVRIPDDEFSEAKMGHFCLVLEPKEVLIPILNWLTKNKQ